MFFSNNILQKNQLRFSGIQTRNIRAEGKHSDHSTIITTTTAQRQNNIEPFWRTESLSLRCLWRCQRPRSSARQVLKKNYFIFKMSIQYTALGFEPTTFRT